MNHPVAFPRSNRPHSVPRVLSLGKRPARFHLSFVQIVIAIAGMLTTYATSEKASDDAENEAPDVQTVVEPEITAEDRNHWAFRPLAEVDPPAVNDAAWLRTPIDRFVLARMEQEGLAPLPAADRLTLLRRVTFDLTGLPPTPEDVQDFLKDDSADAYEKVVQRLLASPAYGERWAQHWLDIARFAETDGFEHDHVRPNAWRYRDWVIDAVNRDLPYDEFVRQQLAGDLLKPADPAAMIATGFLLCGPDMPDINSQDERRHTLLNEMTSTVGAVFLAMQVGCAQCHDHKFDPVSQADFYRLRACFESMDFFREHPLTNNLSEATPDTPRGRVVCEGPMQRSYVWIRGDFRRQGARVRPAMLRVITPDSSRFFDPVTAGVDSARELLAKQLTDGTNPLFARAIANRLWQFHFGEGLVRTPNDFGRMGEEPSHPELLDWLAAEFRRQGWSFKRMHTLLVTSAVYRQASYPGGRGWSTETTELARARWEKSRAVDPQNRWLARMNRRRLEGEAIRDAMLAAGEHLSPRRGGPGVRPPLPQELVSTLLRNQWNVSPDEEDHRRRSIYLFVRRNLRYPLFDVFDRPDTNATCPQRNRSTIAPQALTLLNSEFSLQAAKALTAYVWTHADADLSRRIELAYLRTLSRPPTADELGAASDFLQAEAHQLRTERAENGAPPSISPPTATGDAEADAAETAAFVDFCLALFNLNEFVHTD